MGRKKPEPGPGKLQARRLPNAGSWKPNTSGNPTGRPKTPEEDKARLLEGGRRALEHFLRVLEDSDADPKRHDFAASKLMDFAFAKPAPMAPANEAPTQALDRIKALMNEEPE